MLKKVIPTFMALFVLIGAIAYPATKASAATVTPYYTYISDVGNGLDISGKTLYIDAATYGYSNATSCGVTATLQKQSGSSWTKYASWSANSPSSHPDFVMLSTSITVSSGNYRLVTSHSVTVGSTTEYEGMTSSVVTVS